MNRITQAERGRILARAMEIVRLNELGQSIDRASHIQTLMSEFGISHDRAWMAVSRATMRKRKPKISA